MRKLMLLAGVAALTVAVPVVAQNDHGRGHGGGSSAQQGHGNHGNADGQGKGQGKADRSRGNDDRPRADNRGQSGGASVDRRAARQERRVERAIREERQTVREARETRRSTDRTVREARQDVRDVRQDRRDWRGWAERRLVAVDRLDGLTTRGRRLAVGSTGCPPGLAKQNAWCMPPGQLRRAQLIGQRLPFSSQGYNIPDRYRYRFADSDQFVYRYGNDGTVYRFDRASGLVSSVIPLTSAGLMFGEPMPLGYDVYNVPLAYRSYYPDLSDYLYRYDDNAIYRVDQDSMLVNGIVALLTGGNGGLGGLGIGDRLPLGYDAYNVPLDYRDDYYDTDDSLYRYADGNVYQVDPQTQLIEAIISLIT